MQHWYTHATGLLLFFAWLWAPCGCLTARDDIRPPALDAPQPETTITRALNYLAAQQNPDGSWGEAGTNRPLLTALATLAYLSQGEMPGSKRYGKEVQHGIDFVLSEARMKDAVSPWAQTVPNALSATAWCLADACALTKNPNVRQKILSVLPDWKPDGRSLFDLLAARSIYLSHVETNTPDRSEQIAAVILTRPATNLLDMAGQTLACQFVAGSHDRRIAMAATLLMSATNGWRTSDYPFLTACSASYALFYSGNLFPGWWRSFGVEAARCQLIERRPEHERGWWTSSAFGITSSRELAGLSTHDEPIYTTALIILAHVHPYRRPFLEAIEADSEIAPIETDPDVKVIIR